MNRRTLIKNWIWNRTVRYWLLYKYRNSCWTGFLCTRRIETRTEYLRWMERMEVLTTVITRHYIKENTRND